MFAFHLSSTFLPEKSLIGQKTQKLEVKLCFLDFFKISLLVKNWIHCIYLLFSSERARVCVYKSMWIVRVLPPVFRGDVRSLSAVTFNTPVKMSDCSAARRCTIHTTRCTPSVSGFRPGTHLFWRRVAFQAFHFTLKLFQLKCEILKHCHLKVTGLPQSN